MSQEGEDFLSIHVNKHFAFEVQLNYVLT